MNFIWKNNHPRNPGAADRFSFSVNLIEKNPFFYIKLKPGA
ncbi:hypothetical protein [Lacrimispora sp. JR3]